MMNQIVFLVGVHEAPSLGTNGAHHTRCCLPILIIQQSLTCHQDKWGWGILIVSKLPYVSNSASSPYTRYDIPTALSLLTIYTHFSVLRVFGDMMEVLRTVG